MPLVSKRGRRSATQCTRAELVEQRLAVFSHMRQARAGPSSARSRCCRVRASPGSGHRIAVRGVAAFDAVMQSSCRLRAQRVHHSAALRSRVRYLHESTVGVVLAPAAPGVRYVPTRARCACRVCSRSSSYDYQSAGRPSSSAARFPRGVDRVADAVLRPRPMVGITGATHRPQSRRAVVYCCAHSNWRRNDRHLEVDRFADHAQEDAGHRHSVRRSALISGGESDRRLATCFASELCSDDRARSALRRRACRTGRALPSRMLA